MPLLQWPMRSVPRGWTATGAGPSERCLPGWTSRRSWHPPLSTCRGPEVAVEVTRHGRVTLVTLDRPESRNAVDTEHARLLHNAFLAFEADDDASVAVLHGAGGTFCSGADLRAVADGSMHVD